MLPLWLDITMLVLTVLGFLAAFFDRLGLAVAILVAVLFMRITRGIVEDKP